MFRFVWNWLHARALRTWIGHTLVTILTPLPVALLLPLNGWTFPVLVTGWAVFYARREIGDAKKYMALGLWKTQDPEARARAIEKAGGVPPSFDSVGDLLGPGTAAVVSWLTILLR